MLKNRFSTKKSDKAIRQKAEPERAAAEAAKRAAAAEAAAAQAAADAAAQAAAYAAIKPSRSPRFQRSLNAPIRFSHINLGRPIQPTAMSYSQSRRKSTRRRKNRSRRRKKR